MAIRIAVLALTLGSVLLGQETRPVSNDLIVHEWGTFTSMQGSDGITLEGLHHEEEALPPFVYSRSKLRSGAKGFSVPISRVTEKMETPVTYFYSEKGLRARARVIFNRGLLSQWYPAVSASGPVESARDVAPIDMSKVDKSFLEWNVDVLPKGAARDAVPKVDAENPWRFARLPDSNLLQARNARGQLETESFLFYRGLGQFTLPIQAKTQPGAKLTISNQGRDPIRHLFVLHVRNGRGEYTYLPELPATESVTVTRPVSQDAPEVAAMVRKLKVELQGSLVEEGLYPKEAEAMALTWERSYFHTEGLRVLYVVPDRVTEQLLPLEVSPAPKAMKRVLVGRLECITPEVEAEVLAALREGTLGACRMRLAGLGRFLEPHVRRALAASTDPVVQKNGLAILKVK